MFLSKKHIPRRTFLRGAGMMLGLPTVASDPAVLRGLIPVR